MKFQTIKCNNCEQIVELVNSPTITCGGCGTDYNCFGEELAPREEWGWETGENLADIMNNSDIEN